MIDSGVAPERLDRAAAEARTVLAERGVEWGIDGLSRVYDPETWVGLDGLFDRADELAIAYLGDAYWKLQTYVDWSVPFRSPTCSTRRASRTSTSGSAT